MWRLCLRAMLISMICVCALTDNPSTTPKFVEKREAHRYCGRNLANILKFLCQGHYNGIDYDRKRRDVDFYGEPKLYGDHDYDFWSQAEDVDDFADLHYPFRPRSVSSVLLNKLFRRRPKRNNGGIVEECCIYKGCTLSELTEYCSPVQ
ncbi:LIRP-like [Zootermopsis nevadensis]|uniref:LIRP-like n=1 Tax=Zootermopsis nevadensis TaxID=136037 RepID=UPI000B8E3F5A|nr:LIRP-like [Zootermopsis nevadensis]